MNFHSVHFKHTFSLLALLTIKWLLSYIGYASSKSSSGLKLPSSNYSLFEFTPDYLTNNAITSKTQEEIGKNMQFLMVLIFMFPCHHKEYPLIMYLNYWCFSVGEKPIIWVPFVCISIIILCQIYIEKYDIYCCLLYVVSKLTQTNGVGLRLSVTWNAFERRKRNHTMTRGTVSQ